MLTEKEERIISCLQTDMPVTDRPYLVIAGALSISEDEVIETIQSLCERGVIRRFGATLRHQKSGYSANVMVAWEVPDAKVDEVGEIMAETRNISHCYHRRTGNGWPFNLYTMVHGKSQESCIETVKEVSDKTGITAYQLLFSKRELKKTSMKYYDEECCFLSDDGDM